MSTTSPIIPSTPGAVRSALNAGITPFRKVRALAYHTLVTGPRTLCSGRLTPKTASLMIMLCVPSLLCCAMMTVPAMIFNSEAQRAYFYSARFLANDPACLALMALAGLLAVASLAIPATVLAPSKPQGI